MKELIKKYKLKITSLREQQGAFYNAGNEHAYNIIATEIQVYNTVITDLNEKKTLQKRRPGR